MAAGAPLIPEGALGIAAIADLLIALLDLLALVVLLGMLWVYKQTLGALIGFLVQHTSFKVFGHRITPLFPLDAADNFIQSSMSTAALGLEIAGGRFFHALGVIIGWMVNLALYSATTLEHAFHWLVHVYIPGRASWAASVAFPPALIAKLIRSAIANELPHLSRVVITKTITRVVHTTVSVAHALAHPSTIAIPGIRKDIGWLRRNETNLAKRLHRVEGLFAVGVLAAVVAQVLGIATKCLRKGNVGNAARKICGMDESLIESLLLDGLAIVGAISVVEFANELRAIEGEAVKILGAGIREWPS